MEKPHTIFFLGKPGSGKGTQAKRLATHTHWPIITAGDQFRKIATEDTPVGRKIKIMVESGLLAPNWFAMYLYQKALFSLPENTNIIFDGFNRKPDEARLVISSLKWLERSFIVVNLMVSDEMVYERIKGRSKMHQRSDDDSIKTRLGEYHKYTEQSLELFRDAGEIMDINGEKDPDTIASDIVHTLGF
ncbi:MAG TPA: nucleoside monophosphate kinase [Candidatus Kaiserbacteria bacterium]|nr:nucleoside monophosphate kinase [Candidatus Kaiserbacteria bacterium]